jgi:membrane fusion protein, heavy metal efflux system
MKQLLILVNFSLLLIACSGKDQEAQEPEIKKEENVASLSDAQRKTAGIETGTVQEKLISSVLKVNGKIDVPPQNMVSISVPMGGYLKSTKLLPGMHVNKGQSIALIEDQQYIQLQQDYLTARAQFNYNEREFNRQRELNESKATSDKVFEQTKAAYQTQHVLIKSLEEKLKLIGLDPNRISPDNISRTINIYSPISGYVSAVNVNIGKYVNPSDVLFELVNPTDIHLALMVFEKDLDKLFIGQKLVAYTNNDPEKKYPCEIILISKNVSDERSAEIHCHFEKYDKTLIPGMFMNADIEIKSNIAKVLPEDAIVRYENKQYVFIDKGNSQFEMMEIKAGKSENGFTEVFVDDKTANEKFVVKGTYAVLMKMKNTADE